MAFDLGKAAFGKESVSNLDKIKMIPLDELQVNDQNFYSIEKIDELADSIRMVGLMHPISVVPDDGRYRVISGHRRLAAYRKLNEEELPGKYVKIPALVLRNMDDLSETLALITANSTARELTYSEKLQQENVLRETLTAMKEAGKDVPKNLGQYIADQIGVSRNEVSRMHSVNEKLIPEAREKVDAGEMTAHQAYEMSRKPEDEQKQNLRSYDAQDSLDRYQQEKSEEKALLNRFIEVWAGEYAYKAASVVEARYESIQELGRACRNRGGDSGGVAYFSSAKGVSIGSRTSRPYSWTEIWDAVAMYALKELGRRYIAGEGTETVKHAASCSDGWHTGSPAVGGEYACIVRWSPEMMPSRRVLYWDGYYWHLNRSAASCVANEVEVLGWILLPADNPREVE